MDEQKYTQGLIIDDVHYNIPFASVKRTFDFLEKYANRTEDGDIKIETIGGYQNYSIKIGTVDDSEEYEKLYKHITDVENRFHHVEIPDIKKPFSFYGYFSSITDEMEKILENDVEYKSLSWKMTSKKPTRKA